MRLSSGTKLGTYEVLARLGAGGMGEVYRARDTMLRREVAIKVVHARLCGDPDNLTRFQQEARALAALNHPHVATIHEFDQSDDVCYFVMELVPGETLDHYLARQRRPLTDTLRIMAQVAAALEAAHEKGLIHRDLKPANIKITPDGLAKVLDFGLVKALVQDNEAQADSRVATMGTGSGVVLGTAAYMSPEQTRGLTVDRRTDIWAFGCVLFEALTQTNAFAGETSSDTIVGVLEREPNWQLLPDTVPPTIRKLIRRCLEKDVHRRLRDIGDARLEIEDALAGHEPDAEQAASSRLRFPRVRWAIAGAALAAGVLLGALADRALRSEATPSARPVAHVVIPIPAGERLAGVDFPAVALAPDGSHIVYVAERGGRTHLFLRPMGMLAASPIAGTADALSPFFSSNSQWIAFFAQGKLKKVPVAGGPPITICDADIGFGGSWGVDDTIVFAPTTGSSLWRVSAEGGAPTRITTLDTQRGEFSHRWPHVLPDGKAVLFTVGTLGSWDDAEIVAQSLADGSRQTLLKGGTYPQYLATGHLVYARGGAMLAVPFDANTRATSGSPTVILDSVQESFDGAAQVSVSRSGAIVYVPGASQGTSRRIISVAPSGEVTPLAARPDAYASPRVSPDGRRVAVSISGEHENIWVHDVASGTLTQLTFESENTEPVWHPDGERITFSSNRGGALNLFTLRADGSGAPERLSTSDNVQLPGSWSPDGSQLAFVELLPATGRDVLIMKMAEGRAVERLIATSAHESSPRFSPDGRWLAYVSNESGRNEIYLRSLIGAPQTQQVSEAGGMEPVWSRDGRELFYRAGDGVRAVRVEGRRTSGANRAPLAGRFESGSIDRINYDSATNGGFMMVQAAEQQAGDHELHVLFNWVDAVPSLLARAPARPAQP
jgi:eukaryotic-like serine/threonine-protein kinase